MALNEQTKINLGRLITAQRVLVAPEGLDKDGLIETWCVWLAANARAWTRQK